MFVCVCRVLSGIGAAYFATAHPPLSVRSLPATTRSQFISFVSGVVSNTNKVTSLSVTHTYTAIYCLNSSTVFAVSTVHCCLSCVCLANTAVTPVPYLHCTHTNRPHVNSNSGSSGCASVVSLSAKAVLQTTVEL